jgi:TolB-like protein/Tfp pilus assembly protein PilF
MGGLQKVVIEMRRRRVFRTVGYYIVGCWVALQVAALAFQSLGIPDSALIWVWVAAFAGFPLAVVLGWRYEISARGVTRTPPADVGEELDLALGRADFLILAALAVIVVVFGSRLISEIQDTPIDGAARSTTASIAVLPFENFSGDPDEDYFVDGMHEALIADLARIRDLRVISRTSTVQYRGSDKSMPTIGSELGAESLIEGSVLREGDRVRITVQLIDAANDEHIWAESYERTLTDVLRLQSDVARAIAAQVKVRLAPDEEERLASAKAIDPKAYELYLKGRFHWYKFTEADLNLALQYFQSAIEEDPDYALAYVGFADALATPAHIGMMPTHLVYPAAKQSLQRALALDPDLAEVHDLLARISFAYDWDWDAAERGFRRAIAINPGYPDAHIVYSQFLGVTNRWDESMDAVKAGLDLDPLNPWFRLELAHRYAWFGRSEDAAIAMREIIADQPDFAYAHKYLWNTAFLLGRYDEAASAARSYFELQGEEGVAAALSDAAETSGEYTELMRNAAQVFESSTARSYVSNIERAELHMHAGNRDEALDRLEQAHASRESHLVYTIAEPLFEPVWQSDRYQAILKKMNYRKN